jgi:hypothetical protein
MNKLEETIVNGNYKEFKLTRKEHKYLFPKVNLTWHDIYRYYISDDNVLVIRYTSFLGKIIVTLSLPFVILINGIINIKEIWSDYVGILLPFKKGHYVTVGVSYKSSNNYKNVLEVLNNKVEGGDKLC